MDYRFSATDLQENDFIIIELPNNKSVCINRGDIGYSVDFMNENEDITELGWVSDDDLEPEELSDDEGLEVIRPVYSYSVDDNGTMTIYANNMSVADISDCGNKSPKELTDLMYEVLSERGYHVYGFKNL